MNFASANTNSPRQVLTVGGILVGHALVLAAFLAAPTVHFRTTPKETILLMVSTSQPTPPTRVIATPDRPRLSPTNTLAVEIPVTRTESKDSIQIATSNVTAPEPTPSIAATPVAATPSPAKVENHGPKVISAVEYIQAPQADYPAIAKRMGEEGRVIMQVLVNDKGRAEKVEIIKSSGFNRLDESAKSALMRAVFKPYVEDGKSMAVLATASINFSLRG